MENIPHVIHTSQCYSRIMSFSPLCMTIFKLNIITEYKEDWSVLCFICVQSNFFFLFSFMDCSQSECVVLVLCCGYVIISSAFIVIISNFFGKYQVCTGRFIFSCLTSCLARSALLSEIDISCWAEWRAASATLLKHKWRLLGPSAALPAALRPERIADVPDEIWFANIL